MSYIGEPFQYDVCVSYSHGDAKGKGDSRFKGYSQGFIRELVAELKEHPTFGAQLEVFFDDSAEHDSGLDPMAGLTEQLRGAIGQSAIFIVLMSDHYLRSQWCKHERDFWLQHPITTAFSHGERIALARLWNTTGEWPEILADENGNPFVGVYFYDRTRLPDYEWPYEWPEPGRQSRDPFRRELLTLVGSVWRQVAKVKERVDAHRKTRADAARLKEDTGQLIYLHARGNEKTAWDAANDALSGTGFTVFPGEPEAVERDPTKAQSLRERRVETMSGCDALLLVGSSDVSALEADMLVIGRHDRASANALGRRTLPCALLDTVGATVATPRRIEVARRLRVDWLDCTQPPWTPKVQDWLTQKGTEAEGRAE